MAVFVLTGGGTGGHVYPALAIGDELRKRGHEVLYYGDPDRLEGRVAPERGYPFHPIPTPRFPRGGLWGKVGFAWQLLRAVWTTRRMLKRDGVDVVFGVGGYISVPPMLAAWTLGLGRAIHEANAVAGMANRLSARVAHVVLLTFERARQGLPGRAPRHGVGVPVQPQVLGSNRDEAAARYGLDAEQRTVVFVGGSLGAQRINELALACARDAGRDYQVLHLCGPRFYEEVKAEMGEPPAGVTLKPYEDRMGMAYAMADLVVARAGSSTLAEITAVGRPSLLVPSPNVTENHQEANARSLEEAGAAVVLVEVVWDLEGGVGRVRELMADPTRLSQMGEAARGQARLDAAERAADLVQSISPRSA